MLDSFVNINLKINKILDNYYSLMCGLFALCAPLYMIGIFFFIEWLLFLSTFYIYVFFVIVAFRSLFWFIINLLISPIFVVVILEHYKLNMFFSIALVILWICYWILLSFLVNKNIAKLGNEIVSKILRIAALLGVISVYYATIESDMDLQAILKDTVTIRIILIAINIYMFPSIITLLMFDLRGYYLENQNPIRLKFSFFSLKKGLLRLIGHKKIN